MSKVTQRERIVDYIKQFGSITRLQAFRDLGCVNLPARIFELKRDGIRLKDCGFETGKNRFGETCSWKKWTIEPESESDTTK